MKKGKVKFTKNEFKWDKVLMPFIKFEGFRELSFIDKVKRIFTYPFILLLHLAFKSK